MNWFERLCRDLGLMISHAMSWRRPSRKYLISHRTEQAQPGPTVTLRRTTIEEIELQPQPDNDRED